MYVSDKDLRQRLLTILEAMPQFGSYEGRNNLLRNLPSHLVVTIPRSSTTSSDLVSIVDACLEAQSNPGEPHPIGILLATARGHARGVQRTQLERLISELRPGLVPQIPSPPCPYPGMRPFRPEQAEVFYGRDRERQQLVDRLLLRKQTLLLIVGPSGSGKSSLVLAGLLPELEQAHPGLWQVAILRPGAQPTKTISDLFHVNTIGSSGAIAEYLAKHNERKRLLLVVDQLEEIFTLLPRDKRGRDEQQRFVTTLLALRSSGNCAIILTLRADFYGDLMSSELWSFVKADDALVEIAPLRRQDLKEVIQQPAHNVGVLAQDALVERLVDEAEGEPGSLPLLQETLRLLWDEMSGLTLTVEAYEQLGERYSKLSRHNIGQASAQGEFSGLAAAVALKGDEALQVLRREHGESSELLVRRIFLRLVQFGEGRPNTRRRQPLTELQAAGDDPELFEQTLKVLTAKGLITLSGGEDTNGKLVDLAHEALIESWPVLQGWLVERSESVQYTQHTLLRMPQACSSSLYYVPCI